MEHSTPDHHVLHQHAAHVLGSQVPDLSQLQQHHEHAVAVGLPVQVLADGQLTAQEYTSEGQEEESGQFLLTTKRLVDDVLSQPGLMGVPMPTTPDVGPEKKRRKTTNEQQAKRAKYDVLKAFFRVYFVENKDGMVLKDVIYKLYAKKIPPNQRIARNAMYRHMWSFFKNEISAFQSNYREYIKGIKMITNEGSLSYDGCEKDVELLQAIGVNNVFDFQEEELEKNDKNFAAPQYMNDEPILSMIEQLEQQAKALTTSLRELKARIKKRNESFPPSEE